jgi:hypothetical protein
MNEAEEFFVRECAAHAKTLSVSAAVLYLRGMMLLCPQSQALQIIAGIYNAIIESESQLELIHSGQLKLDFTRTKKGGIGK